MIDQQPHAPGHVAHAVSTVRSARDGSLDLGVFIKADSKLRVARVSHNW